MHRQVHRRRLGFAETLVLGIFAFDEIFIFGSYAIAEIFILESSDNAKAIVLDYIIIKYYYLLNVNARSFSNFFRILRNYSFMCPECLSRVCNE